MAKFVVLDQVHLAFRVPAGPGGPAADAATRVLAGRRFAARLRRAVRAVVRRHPALARVRVTLSR